MRTTSSETRYIQPLPPPFLDGQQVICIQFYPDVSVVMSQGESISTSHIVMHQFCIYWKIDVLRVARASCLVRLCFVKSLVPWLLDTATQVSFVMAKRH